MNSLLKQGRSIQNFRCARYNGSYYLSSMSVSLCSCVPNLSHSTSWILQISTNTYLNSESSWKTNTLSNTLLTASYSFNMVSMTDILAKRFKILAAWEYVSSSINSITDTPSMYIKSIAILAYLRLSEAPVMILYHMSVVTLFSTVQGADSRISRLKSILRISASVLVVFRMSYSLALDMWENIWCSFCRCAIV